MIKIIFSFIAMLLVHGCAITPIYENIPKTEKDFQLSQGEILNKFPAISNHHIENLGDSNKSIPLYKDIVKDWGEPISKKKEWLRHIWNHVNLGSIAYTAFGSFDALWLIFEGTMISTNPYPPETYTWYKGDYKIDATFYNRLNQNKKYFAYWKWQKKENLALTNILPTTPDKNFYFRLGFSTGGEKVIKTKNSTIDYYPIGRGITLQLGYSYNLFSDNSNRLKFAAGIKDSGLLDHQSGAKLIEYPVDALYSPVNESPFF